MPTPPPPPVSTAPGPVPGPGSAPYRPPVQGQPGYPGPGPQGFPPPPRKSNALVIAIAAVGGVAVLGVGAWLLLGRKPAPAVNPNPKPPVANNNPDKPANPQPDPNPNPPPAPPGTGTVKAKVLAQGQIDFPNWRTYDSYGGKQLGLAGSDGTYVNAKVFEFANGTFKPVLEAAMPMGQVLDVNHGPMFNDGRDWLVVLGEKGTLFAPEDGDFELNDKVTNIKHTIVGDWDGDGRHETLLVAPRDGQFLFEIWRYKAGEQGELLSKPDPLPQFILAPQAIRIPGEEQSFLMGFDTVQLTDALPLTVYEVDAVSGKFSPEVGLAIHQKGSEQFQGYAVGDIGGEAVLVVSYTDAGQSYLELFDILSVGGDTYAPPKSLGKIQLPDNSRYVPMLGQYTGQGSSEILALTPEGKWVVYGF